MFTPKAAVVFILTGAELYFYFNHEKQKLQERKIRQLHRLRTGHTYASRTLVRLECMANDGL